MFTGIVEEIGYIKSVSLNSINIYCKKILEDINIGDSISVDGVCLTVTSFNSDSFSADISNETKNITKLGTLKPNDVVNLERAMLVSSRFGGHIVSGHIDCVATVVNLSMVGDFYDFEIKFPSKEFIPYFVKKGSITIDGMSLTIYDLTVDTVKVAIIPHSFNNTNLRIIKKGDLVNVEFDILSKYIEKKLLMNDNKNNINEGFLKDNGFI